MSVSLSTPLAIRPESALLSVLLPHSSPSPYKTIKQFASSTLERLFVAPSLSQLTVKAAGNETQYWGALYHLSRQLATATALICTVRGSPKRDDHRGRVGLAGAPREDLTVCQSKLYDYGPSDANAFTHELWQRVAKRVVCGRVDGSIGADCTTAEVDRVRDG